MSNVHTLRGNESLLQKPQRSKPIIARTIPTAPPPKALSRGGALTTAQKLGTTNKPATLPPSRRTPLAPSMTSARSTLSKKTEFGRPGVIVGAKGHHAMAMAAEARAAKRELGVRKGEGGQGEGRVL